MSQEREQNLKVLFVIERKAQFLPEHRYPDHCAPQELLGDSNDDFQDLFSILLPVKNSKAVLRDIDLRWKQGDDVGITFYIDTQPQTARVIGYSPTRIASTDGRMITVFFKIDPWLTQ